MAHTHTPEQIRALRAESPKARARDFAAMQGITEADLVAAYVGHTATAIEATPDALFPLIGELGDVMALTRNESCVHERRGVYKDFHSGPHAAMVLGSEIDMRMFPSHWKFGFALVEAGEDGPKRSIQVFDAAGDAVHKVHLKPESDVAAFDALVAALRLSEQADHLSLIAREPVEGPKGDPARVADLRTEWKAMTDTHQFLKLTRRLKFNRLGANRMVGAPYAAPVARDAITQVLHAAADQKIPLMIFVGNAGCIQIHGGPIEKVVPMGPWINVMDPRFNLHLRADHIAEVWRVTKPTQRGDAISVEAFDAEGGLILQIFGYRKDAPPVAWDAFVTALPVLEAEMA
ncbi:MAG: ChuX/HutX family heme-like substrate-binding protein [Cypionkella sp.]|uniref:hemin-degrading factor n=1 Tax=Cypionkella sp. TaxID=2811411 RepID=UPI002ABB1977|nr:ChuX/HutX family heme-like substrate-binding protein [Cypionkella sp.]MDZ4308998.1 ChuX/HutX family heme-like substrate-binding protein [Cypionkella sp.]